MSDKPLVKKIAIGACIACCALNVAIIVGAGSVLTSIAALSQSPATFIAAGFVLIGAASYLIWKRGREAASCDVAKA